MAGNEDDLHYYQGDPMYWLIPLGFGLGCLVVVAFERFTESRLTGGRVAHFKNLTFMRESEKLDRDVEFRLASSIDGLSNVANFWSGSALQWEVDREHLQTVYETLALVSALLLTVCVTFYTSNDEGDHLYGIVSCVANCALWMSTLSATFFAVVIHSLKTDQQLDLLINLYGEYLMRVPMMLFVWGTTGIFLEFILYFKLNVDPGFPCSMCLGTCFIVAPLFFHCLHKMGWAAAVVHTEAAAAKRNAVVPTVNEIQATLFAYVKMKGGNVLALDRDEYLDELGGSLRTTHITSVQRALAAKLFDAHVESELSVMMGPVTAVDAPAPTKAEPRSQEASEHTMTPDDDNNSSKTILFDMRGSQHIQLPLDGSREEMDI